MVKLIADCQPHFTDIMHFGSEIINFCTALILNLSYFQFALQSYDDNILTHPNVTLEIEIQDWRAHRPSLWKEY